MVLRPTPFGDLDDSTGAQRAWFIRTCEEALTHDEDEGVAKGAEVGCGPTPGRETRTPEGPGDCVRSPVRALPHLGCSATGHMVSRWSPIRSSKAREVHTPVRFSSRNGNVLAMWPAYHARDDSGNRR